MLEFERIGTEIFIRSKPHMGEDCPFSARRICWPPPQHACYRNHADPHLPINNAPPILPLQAWKDYEQVRSTLYQFYNDPSWGTPPDQRAEMLDFLRKWGERPSRANCCPIVPWPDRWEVSRVLSTHAYNHNKSYVNSFTDMYASGN